MVSKKKLVIILMFICIHLNSSIIFKTNINTDLQNNVNDKTDKSGIFKSTLPKQSGQNKIIGNIFSNITNISRNCYINRDNLILNEQPKLYLGNWSLTYSQLRFENITALNHTRIIEANPNDVYINSDPTPLYLFQKFSIRLNQYVHNVSIFIQDLFNPMLFNDENSWEVAILNCSNDGFPNETIGKLQKPHPTTIFAHWSLFDFRNSGIGPIFLNVSNTNFTVEENGSSRYWYAIRIKVPPNDTSSGGGPKFIYHNNSNITSKIGIGIGFSTLKPSDINMQVQIENENHRISDLDFQTGIWSSNISNGNTTNEYFQFNISSTWHSVPFDVIGNHSIEHSNEFNCSYKIDYSKNEILWNVSTIIYHFGQNLGDIINYSKGFQLNVPNKWSLIQICNNSDYHFTSNGGWNWSIEVIDIQKSFTFKNVTEGSYSLIFLEFFQTSSSGNNDKNEETEKNPEIVFVITIIVLSSSILLAVGAISYFMKIKKMRTLGADKL